MASQQVESEVLKAVKESTNYGVDIIARWINNSLIANNFIVSELKRPEFTYNSLNDMKFTALVRVFVAPDFDESIIQRVTWVKAGKTFSREFGNP